MVEFEDPSDSVRMRLEHLAASIACPTMVSDAQARLIEIYQEYQRSVNQPPEPRQQIRYELRMIAHLIGKIETGVDVTAAKDELATLLQSLKVRTLDVLARHLEVASLDLMLTVSDRAGWRQLGSAAQAALRTNHRGDYADANLCVCVLQLVCFFEQVTGTRATYSARLTGEFAGDGGQRKIGSSPCAVFARGFFTVAAPDMPHTKVDNALIATLSTRALKATPTQTLS